MIRILAAAAGALILSGLAGAAHAQTWGQPVYVSPYGHVVGGTPLSEVETRSHVNTGRWADGYADQAYVYVPAPVHGRGYGYSRYGWRDHGRGYGYGHGYGRSEPRAQAGYRDVWGYNDDRHPTARGGSRDRRDRRDRRYDHDCGCGDVYLYDR